MTYRDMTFCAESTCAKFGKGCFRSYTDEVRQRAVKWWGSEDAPVSFFSEKPECYESPDRANCAGN